MPKGRAMGLKENAENFNSLRPILYELCKQNTGERSNCPPPAGIGLKVGLGTCFTLRAKLLGVGGVENTPPTFTLEKLAQSRLG